MIDDDDIKTGRDLTIELTPEAARKKREYHLELAHQRAKRSQQNPYESDAADASLATFILPGD